jgi:hypothetical protein
VFLNQDEIRDESSDPCRRDYTVTGALPLPALKHVRGAFDNVFGIDMIRLPRGVNHHDPTTNTPMPFLAVDDDFSPDLFHHLSGTNTIATVGFVPRALAMVL